MDTASRKRFFTCRSISPLLAPESSFAEVQAGRPRISGGKSHSCDRPTSRSAAPNAHTISVAAGKSETMRCVLMRLPSDNKPVRFLSQKQKRRGYPPRLLGLVRFGLSLRRFLRDSHAVER